MNPQLCKFIVRLFGLTLLAACAPQSIPNTPTPPPATAIPATPTWVPTSTAAPLEPIGVLPTVSLATVNPSMLPTFSFVNPLTPTPTTTVQSPFEFVAALDEMLPGTDDRAYFRSASDGSIWSITNGGIARLTDSDWYLSDYTGSFVGIDSLGRAWFIKQNLDAITPPARGGATYPPYDSISAWDGAQWTTYSSKSGWTGFYTDGLRPSMAEFHDQIWVSTQMDLRVFNGSRWKVITPEELGLQSPLSLAVHSFPEAEEIWVTGCYFNTPRPYGSDIIWYDGSTWQRKAMPEEGGCPVLLVEHKGHVWIATNDSLWAFTRATKEWTHYALTQPPSTHITSLAFNDSGEPWFISLNCDSQTGCTETTIYHLHNEIWIPISPLPPGTRFFSLLIDSANQVWASASDGIYQIVNDQPNLVSHLITYSWSTDRTGKIWAIGRDPSADNRFSLWVTNP